ncbi:unnamed protein product [Lymnaea stagnalis]|uniref:Uncharacterized protein n=1 Tax=Lymnaea stagnalis TaxID=6523 RepID=A0AAV2HB37_LYMST
MASHLVVAALLVVALMANLSCAVPVPAEVEGGNEFQDATTEAPIDGQGGPQISGKSLNLNSLATILLLRNALGTTNTGINTGLFSGINSQNLLTLLLLGRLG